MRPQIVKVAVAVAILSSFVGRSAWGDVQYTVTDLGVLPGFTYGSGATSINNNGQVVGNCVRSSDYKTHAFLWQRDMGLQDIGTFGGKDTMAMDINNCGQIVGSSESGVVSAVDPKGHHGHAFFWENGSVMRDILNDDGWKSYASAINDNGLVTGVSRALDCDGDPSNPHAFLWQIGDVPQLLDPWFEPTGINNAGQVVGTIAHAGQNGAYIWQQSTGLQNIGILPGDTRVMTKRINDKGQVVGYSHSPPPTKYHAFLWQPASGMQDLGSLGSGEGWNRAEDINNREQAVGTSNNCAFVWQSETGMVDLNTIIDSSSGLTLRVATGINDNGWIVGTGVNSSGQYRAFLLIPEPAIIALDLDILPGSGRNPFIPNKKSMGKIPMAILATEEVAAEDIDPESILIAGVLSPVKISTGKDVDGDGIVDLVMHFSRRGLIEAMSLDTYEVGAVVEITVTAIRLSDSAPIEATDSIVIVGPNN